MIDNNVYRWLKTINKSEHPEIQPPFNDRGEPVFGDHAPPNRPKLFTYDELQNAKIDESMETGDSPIAIPKPIRQDSIRKSKQTSNVPGVKETPGIDNSVINSGTSVALKPGLETTTATDHTGQKVFFSNERTIYLHEGENIDPSGTTTQSICPSSSGRSRSLSRSDAIKRPESPFAGENVDLERLKKVTSNPTSNKSEVRPSTASSTHSKHAPPACLQVPNSGVRIVESPSKKPEVQKVVAIQQPRVSRFEEHI